MAAAGFRYAAENPLFLEQSALIDGDQQIITSGTTDTPLPSLIDRALIGKHDIADEIIESYKM